ncbi:beta-galactosidase [Planctomycetales bacterium]|nr:beta-galactosidase [Planctomycetales bacterium]
MNLNGLWDFAADTANLSTQIHFDKKILVPFPPGSRLSGVPPTADRYVYHRKFVIPPDWNKTDRILLNFGASDWETTVRINGKNVGSHRGGYDPFSFDITDNLKQDTENELMVTVFDPTNRGQQPRGKQSETPSGVWYSAVTGIWQTVWLEPVPQNYIKSVKIAPDYDSASIEISYEIQTSADTDQSQLILYAEILDGETVVAKCFGGSDGKLLVRLDKAIMKSWSPDSPFLYQVAVKLLNGRHVNDHTVSDTDKIVDQIGSYLAFRKVERIREQNGHSRIWLNGKPLFQLGVIDQGYWSDGLYTAPTDTAIRMDIRVAKSLGFNVIRKYQKIEPERWYFWCDRLGVLVWQDMPSGENRSEEAQNQFQVELQRMLETLAVHPSIVLWTIFNEGAGQHTPAKYLEMVKKIDPTRLVNLTSGWTDSKIGDVNVSHKLPKIEMPSPDANRVSVIGMYGGMTLIPPQENCWTPDIWGYLHVPDSETLLKNYREMQMTLRKMIAANGLAGAMFHQLTDVESECNGLTSYDRVILKIPVDEIEKLNKETIKQGSRL